MTIIGISLLIGLVLSFIIWVIPIIIKKIKIVKIIKKRNRVHKKLPSLLKWNATSFTKTFEKEDSVINMLNKLKSKDIQRMADYVKSHKLGEVINEGFAYCDFCGIKLFDGKEHDTQDCLIKKYKEVIIE